MPEHHVSVAFLVLGTALPAFAGPVSGEAFFDLRPTAIYAQNVGRAERSAEVEDDVVYGLDATAGYQMTIGRRSGLILKGGLAGRHHQRLGDLSNYRVHGSAAYLIQPGQGFSSPWYALSAGLSLLEHRDSAIRDGTRLDLGAQLGTRMTDRIALRAEYGYARRNAFTGETFDIEDHTLGGTVEYTLRPRAVVYTGYAFSTGDVVTDAGMNPRLRSVAKAVAPDAAFPGRRAWRLAGDTHDFRLGTRIGFSRRDGVDLSGRYFATDAAGNNQWHGWLVGAAYVYRFE